MSVNHYRRRNNRVLGLLVVFLVTVVIGIRVQEVSERGV